MRLNMYRLTWFRQTLFVLFLGCLILPSGALGQTRNHPLGQNLRFTKFESNTLAGNLIADPSRRELMVLLPPSYYRNLSKRFPAVYLLHGVGKRRDGHLDFLPLFIELFNHMKNKKLDDMILVAVDGTTIFGGSYYAHSPTIGNFEKYIGEEIVATVDSLYRTKSARQFRAVAGFSMGGHGAIKLAMKYSDVFGQVGSLSGSPMSIRYRKSIYRNALRNHRKPKTIEQLIEMHPYEKNWTLVAAYAKAAAFSPNLSKPPLYLNLPFEAPEVDEDDPIWTLWYDDDPLGLVARYQRQLKTLERIYIDHGHDETTLGTEDFVRELARYGIGPTYYIYRGDHVDKLSYRYLRMLRTLSLTWMYE